MRQKCPFVNVLSVALLAGAVFAFAGVRGEAPTPSDADKPDNAAPASSPVPSPLPTSPAGQPVATCSWAEQGFGATAPSSEASGAPVRIGLQAGHWKASEAPTELRRVRNNGTQWQDVPEWEVNLTIARLAEESLTEMGYEVDILPATVPPRYKAELFVAIHADGHDSPSAAGFRVVPSRRSERNCATIAATTLQETYGRATGLRLLATATWRMRNYYAFNYRRYHHAIDPSTVGIIIETGFLTSPRDRQIIVDRPEKAAQGIVEAIREIFPPSAEAAPDLN